MLSCLFTFTAQLFFFLIENRHYVCATYVIFLLSKTKTELQKQIRNCKCKG